MTLSECASLYWVREGQDTIESGDLRMIIDTVMDGYANEASGVYLKWLASVYHGEKLRWTEEGFLALMRLAKIWSTRRHGLQQCLETLQLPQSAREAVKTYRQLCLQYHPDKDVTSTTEDFADLHKAYQAVREHFNA